MRPGRFWSGLIAATFVFTSSGFIQAQQNTQSAVERALDLLEDNNARQAVAILADAARRSPQDRKLGGLLYTLLRDKRWPLPATIPVKLPAAITVLRFSPDAKLVIAGAEDGTVRILDTDSGKLLAVTEKHPGAVICAAILPGNALAFSLGQAGDAHLWKIADGSTVKQWSNQSSTFSACAISKDFRRLALGYTNGEVRVYDRDLEKQLGETIKHSRAITSLGFSPDGETLGTGSLDGTAHVFDLATGKARQFVVKHGAPLVSVEIGRHDLLLTASGDGIARILNATEGQLISEINCGAKIRNAHLGGSGTYLSTVLDDNTVRIWECQTGKAAQGVIRTDEGIVDADWGPAGISMVTASDGPIAYTWRVRTGQRVSEGMLHQSPVRVVAYGPNSRRIATGCADGTLRIWRVDVGAASEGLPSTRSHNAAVRSAFYSADGQGLVSCADDLTTIRWEMGTVRPLGHALPFDGGPVCATYSPNRSFIVTVTADGKAFVSDGKSGETHGAPRDLGAAGRWVDFHKNGKEFLTTAGTKAVIWSVDDAAPIGPPIQHPANQELRMARFSPSGNFVVTTSDDGTARVWETNSRRQVAILKKHEGPVTSARFSLDGKLLVTTGSDSQIIVWDTTTWQPTGRPLILPGEVHSAVIGPNDQFVGATSQLSEGVRFFDLSTGRPFGGIDMPTEAVTVDLHPSGDALVVAGVDGAVRTYGSPWVEEDIPKWMPDFAEKIIGIRVDGPDKFAPVYSNYQEIQQYPPAGTPPDADFGRLAKWMVTLGIERTMSPRSFATIASNVAQRVAERSLDSLYDLFEAQPANPLIIAAMSLFVPRQQQGEYLAEYALARAENYPLARAYVASTFAKYGRTDEAERIMKDALSAAPNDARVLRRAAKLDTRKKRKQAAIEKLEGAVAADPEDEVTYRDYGWQMYDLDEPARALVEFRKADEFYGGRDTDVNAGIALAAAALGDEATAMTRYKRMIRIGAEWGEAEYIRNLKGWTDKELVEMERLRKRATAPP